MAGLPPFASSIFGPSSALPAIAVSQATAKLASSANNIRSRWQQTYPTIPDSTKWTSWDGLEHFVVKKLALRQLLLIIKESFEDEDAAKFHFTPFRDFFQPTPDVPPQRVYGETYTTDD